MFRAPIGELRKLAKGRESRISVGERTRTAFDLVTCHLLRQDLKTAGIERPELFEHNAHRLQVRAHDLRASFITVALAAGRTETWVTDRTGHTTSDQLRNYRRAARTVAELALGDFEPLHLAVPELGSIPQIFPKTGFRRRDSNSDKRYQKPLSCH